MMLEVPAAVPQIFLTTGFQASATLFNTPPPPNIRKPKKHIIVIKK